MDEKIKNIKPLQDSAAAAELFEKLPADDQSKIIELMKSILSEM